MQLSDILTPGRVHCGVQVSSKKRILEYISDIFAQDLTSLTQQEILNCLQARERYGTTGFGNGVAIPHARVPQMDYALCAFIHLHEAIDYNALDEKPVDLLFALVIPEQGGQEYLNILAHIAAIFSDENFRECLRLPSASEEKYQMLVQWRKEDSAA